MLSIINSYVYTKVLARRKIRYNYSMTTTTDYKTRLNDAVRPQDNFFDYVNSKWIAENPIPPSESRWGSFDVLRDEAWQAMQKIYDELATMTTAKPGSVEQQARDLFYTGMHVDDFEATHLDFIRAQFKKIDEMTDLAATIGTLQDIGMGGPWRVIIDIDDKDSSKPMIRFAQDGLTLPDRDYYLEQNDKMQSIRDAYKAHLAKVRSFFPELALTDNALWSAVFEFEKQLATISRTRTALRDVEKNYNKTTFAELCSTYSNINWPAFAKNVGWPTSDQISVDQPEFFAFLNEQFASHSLDEWKIYFKWHLLLPYYGRISERFANLKFDFFGKVMSGTTEIMPLWKRVTNTVDGAMGEGVGQLYVARHFSEDAKHQVLAMVEDIRATYKKRMLALDWMAEPTKQYAIKKLSNMKVLIGYPDTWRDFSAMQIGRTSYIENIVAAERFNNAYYFAKLQQPISRDEWLMYPQTVNAYHDPNRNVICFPAAILQTPFFDPSAPLAANLGGIGAVIGHELTHGFDDQGCQFDADGNVRMWQTQADRDAFSKRAQIIIDQADNFEVLPGLTLIGKLVIGESIADLGGVELAYDALVAELGDAVKKPGADGLTPEEIFFINFATSECGQTREEKLREYTLSDPHPNAHFRVNAMLQHVDSFYDAFGVTEGDAQYRTPADRAKIW